MGEEKYLLKAKDQETAGRVKWAKCEGGSYVHLGACVRLFGGEWGNGRGDN